MSRTMSSMLGVNKKLTPFLRRAVVGRIHLDISGRNFRQYERPPRRERSCFRSRGMGMRVKADAFSAFERTPAGEMEWSRKSASVAPGLGFRGGELKVVLAQSLEEGTRMVLMWVDGSESNTITSSRYASTCFRPLVTSLITFAN